MSHSEVERFREQKLEYLAQFVSRLLDGLGEDVHRPGLVDTPMRVAKMYWDELFTGIGVDLKLEVNKAIFKEETHGMVIVADIPFYSICEHHLVPFHGVGHVGYIPLDGRVVGLSKIARILDTAARKPQVQERLTSEIADALFNSDLNPEGVGVMIQAEHLCMGMRGVRKPGSMTTTSEVRGSFHHEPETRSEWLTLLQQQRD